MSASSAVVPLLTRVVAASVSIVRRAEDIVRSILKTGDLKIVHKGLNDLQTEADRSAQRCIIASLLKQFPQVSVFGEEDLSPLDVVDNSFIVTETDADVLEKASTLPEELRSVRLEDICIWVDPLDGTAEFTEGLLDHVTVLVGIAVKGKAVAGIISQPYYNYEAGPDVPLGRIIWGIVGLGAFGLARQRPPEDKRIITTTRSHMTSSVTEAINACQPTEVLQVGGAGHKVLLLIEGRAHAYLFASPGCKKWDTCAPEAILHAVGGKLTDVNGRMYEYHSGVDKRNQHGTLATALTEEHDWYLKRMSPTH